MDSQDSWLDVSPEHRAGTPEQDEDDETQLTAAARRNGSARDVSGAWDQEEVLKLDDVGALEVDDEEVLVALDEGLPSGEVLHRIEQVVAQLVEDVSAGKPPTMQLISRFNAAAVQQQDEAPSLGVAGRMQTRALMTNQGAGALAFARVFLVLEVVHELLRAGRKATQRDIYYKLISPPLIANQADVNSAIQDAVALLRVPRSSLGICCAPRGAVSGKLQIKDGPMSPWQDCSTAGCPDQVEALGLRCSARYLLIVEKDAIFQSLTQDRLFDALPCILVTAKGMPDLATRSFCARLTTCFPSLTVVGLVDWNPSGVAILKTYKYGSGSLDSSRFALPSLRWLGLRAGMMGDIDQAQLQPLTRRDLTLATSLGASLAKLGEPEWCWELGEMTRRGAKAEIECLYTGPRGMAGLCATISEALLRRAFMC